MIMFSNGNEGTLSCRVIRNAFIHQYYYLLHETPDQMYKFYQDTSSLGRAGFDGVMEYITTLPEIKKFFMSMDLRNSITVIETEDALLSHNDGVFIVVTGSSLTMSHDVAHRFTQSFFLAPQESGGYFVLSDILRCIPERKPVMINQVLNQENEGKQNDGSVAESDPTPVPVDERLNTDHVVLENNVADGEVLNPTVNGITAENNATLEPPVQIKAPVAALPPAPARKASILSYLFSRLLHLWGL